MFPAVEAGYIYIVYGNVFNKEPLSFDPVFYTEACFLIASTTYQPPHRGRVKLPAGRNSASL